MRVIGLVVVVALGVAGCSSKPAVDPNASAWTTAKLGTVYESTTITQMVKPFERQTVTTTKHTLLGRTKTEAKLKLELAEGDKTTASEVSVPLQQAPVNSHDGSTVTTAEEKCMVPAGTFDCTKTTVEVHQGEVTRSTVTWTAKKVPVPLKQIVTNENMTMTTELVSITAGR
jgi:hypothetical protein